MIRFTGHKESRLSVDRPGPKTMENEVWPGLLLSSAGVQLYHTQQYSLGVSDDTDTDTSFTSEEQTRDDDSSIAESVELRNSGKPKKSVTFKPDDCLVQIQEIPARGEETEFDFSDSVDLSVSVITLPVPEENPPSEHKPDLSISGRSATVLANQSVEKPEKLERPVVNRNNRDIRGCFTVTHAIAPARQKPTSSQKQPKVPSPNPCVQKATTVPVSKGPATQQDCQQTPKSPSPVSRKPIVRGKIMGRIRKRVPRGTKESKVKADNASNLEQDGVKKPDDSQANCVNEEEISAESQIESSPKKIGRPRTGKKSTNSTKNKENNRVDGNRRINRSNPNYSSVSQRNGPRNLYRRFNPTDYTGVRSSFSAISSERTKVRIPSKHPLSVDTAKLNMGPKVKVPAFGRVKSAPSKIMNKLEKMAKQEDDPEKFIHNDIKTSTNDTTYSDIKSTTSPITKSNNFIFPEESKFRFPLMTPQTETTSQLVRLDSNMLSLYKKKLYAWHMANGIMPESRIETPCIAPMWEPTRTYQS